MTAANQPIWRITPLSGSLPAPSGSLGVIMGQATLLTSSATVSVPFGGTKVKLAIATLEGTATATVGNSVVVSRTITTATDADNYVTFKGQNSTDGVFDYFIVGYMDEADASV